MDPLAVAAKIILAIIMMLGGLIYVALRVLVDIDDRTDQGFLYGFGPILTGLGVAVAGVLILIY